MASTVQIVLKENLEHLGSIGDVVRVRRGYARNFLIPRGKAVVDLGIAGSLDRTGEQQGDGGCECLFHSNNSLF